MSYRLSVWRACASRARLVQVALAGVEQERRAGECADTADLLRMSQEMLEDFTRDVGGRLAEWERAARALAALHPLAPLGLRKVRVVRLRRHMAGWRLAHMFAVTSGERFRLRVMVLRRMLGVLATHWRRAHLPRMARAGAREPRCARLGRTGCRHLRSAGRLAAERRDPASPPGQRPKRDPPARVTRPIASPSSP